MTRWLLLEIAIESIEDAVAAVDAGADRLEICAALDCGGLTPTAAAVSRIRRAVDVPLLVMVRPRNGGFCYSAAEFETMCEDAVRLCAPRGADGIVFGVLHEDGRIDAARCAQLIAACRPRQTVFHRAFDVTPDPMAALDTLVELGVTRILTSGGMPRAADADAMAGIDRLVQAAAGRIEVLPASGIRASCVADIVRRTRCRQVHAACRSRRIDMDRRALPPNQLDSLRSINGPSGESYGCVAANEVAALRHELDRVATLHGLL